MWYTEIVALTKFGPFWARNQGPRSSSQNKNVPKVHPFHSEVYTFSQKSSFSLQKLPNFVQNMKKRLVYVKHIYSGSLFQLHPYTKRNWHRFCQKSTFSQKSKIPSNDGIWRRNSSVIDRDMHFIVSDTVKNVILYHYSIYRFVTSTERKDMPW